VAVGYGTDSATGMNYYMIRNSWGSAWGDNGYVKFAREGDGYGVCGV
jgi:C1A family cysteine protease